MWMAKDLLNIPTTFGYTIILIASSIPVRQKMANLFNLPDANPNIEIQRGC
jgi:hypothetical protein